VSEAPLRFGILGAARIAPMALVRPARQVAGVQVFAVAARERARAERFAGKQGITRVHDDYAALIEDPEIDAIYNPLPNSLHCEWTIRALEAGKHVLCEKPMAANANEARQMSEAAEKSGRVLAEAFHWRYHPLADRVADVVSSGRIGEVEHIEAVMCIPLPLFGDIRYRYDLAGGATMDLGCYTINMIRRFAGAEPEVLSAQAKLQKPDVDRLMEAHYRFADGRTAYTKVALFSARLLDVHLRIRGSDGEVFVLNPTAAHVYHRLRIRDRSGSESERVPGDPTYVGQLRAFVAEVRGGPPMPSDHRDAIANMAVIDATYLAAQLPLR